jgi:hypothetical protein
VNKILHDGYRLQNNNLILRSNSVCVKHSKSQNQSRSGGKRQCPDWLNRDPSEMYSHESGLRASSFGSRPRPKGSVLANFGWPI